jgi:hypothetical protein
MILDWPGLFGAFQIAVPNVRAFVNRKSGTVVRLGPNDATLASCRADADWIALEPIAPAMQFAWVRGFIDLVADSELKRCLRMAADGKGAFRRFKDVLGEHPVMRSQWFDYRDARMRDLAVERVAHWGLRPSNSPPWTQAQCPGIEEELRGFLGSYLGPEKTEDLATLLLQRFDVAAKNPCVEPGQSA